MPQPGICVDPAQPLDMSHPLNRGLVSEWSQLPMGQWGRGTLLRDLVGKGQSNNSTLTNAPTWIGSKSRTGGYGSLSFDDASSQYSVLASAVVTAQPLTLTAWVRTDDTTINQVALSIETAAGTARWQIQGVANSTFRAVSVNSGGGLGVADSVTMVANTWYFVVGVFLTNTSRTIYVNGRNAVTNTTNITVSGVDQTTIGARTSSGSLGAYWSGQLDGLQVFNRALADTEVLELYHESSAGNPNRWRWLGRRAYFFPAAAATGNRRRRVLMMGAV